MSTQRYPQHMIRCPSVEDREKLRKLIKRLSGLTDKSAYDTVFIALEKYEYFLRNPLR